MTALLATLALIAVALLAVVWAIRYELRDDPDRLAWLRDWSDYL